MCSPKLNTPDKNYQLKICQIHRSKRQNVGTELLFNKQHLSGYKFCGCGLVLSLQGPWPCYAWLALCIAAVRKNTGIHSAGAELTWVHSAKSNPTQSTS